VRIISVIFSGAKVRTESALPCVVWSILFCQIRKGRYHVDSICLRLVALSMLRTKKSALGFAKCLGATSAYYAWSLFFARTRYTMLTASSSSSSPNCPICNPALRQTRNRGMEIDSAGDAHTVPSPPAQRASDQLGAIGAQFEERDGSTPNPECCTQCEAVGYRVYI